MAFGCSNDAGTEFAIPESAGFSKAASACAATTGHKAIEGKIWAAHGYKRNLRESRVWREVTTAFGGL
jgi:hypothetical protein